MFRFFYLLAAVVVFISCQNKLDIRETELDKLYITLYSSKSNGVPLNLMFDLNKNQLIVYYSEINVLSVKPPNQKLGEWKENNSRNFYYSSEILLLNQNVSEKLKELLDHFKADDYESFNDVSLDGFALKYTLFFSNNTYKEITLVNKSTDKQKELLRIVLSTVRNNSKQKDLVIHFEKFNS